MTSCLIPSTGMEPSLYPGDRILVNRWSYGLRLPLMQWWGYHRPADRPVHRGDLLVFNNPGNLSEPVADRREVFISRCLGTPGDILLVDSLFSVHLSGAAVPDRKFLYAYPRQKERWLDSLQDLRPLIVPSRGKTIRVHPWNRTLLCNTLVLHEHKQAEIRHDTLYVEGCPVQHCFFSQDYYWVGSNNSVNLSDSRLFGFVPKDHVIGRASLVWFSKEPDTGLFKGYRWNRMGRQPK